MNRFLSSVLACAFALSLATGAAFAGSSTMHASGKTSHKHMCPKGQTWVHGYTKADGTKVKGYCRKSG